MSAAAAAGPKAVAGARAMTQLLHSLTGLDEAQQLRRVNNFFNRRVHFASDQEVWGVADHWASPLELLQRGQGDCEDYAIAKFAVLRAAGMPESRLRLAYGTVAQASQTTPHLVLLAEDADGASVQVLDNLNDEVLPLTQRKDLRPQFSFNLQGLWFAQGEPAGDPLKRLPSWRRVASQLEIEGLR